VEDRDLDIDLDDRNSISHGYNSIDYSFVYCLVLPYSVLTEQEAQIADHTAYDALINCHLLVTSMTISPMFTAT